MTVIGIDVSKEHLDLALLDGHGQVVAEERVTNDARALTKLLKAMQRRKGLHPGALVCLEATGHYGYRAITACVELGLRGWVAHPTDIQLSLGMQRGKNDRWTPSVSHSTH